jgi:hypothetical protein
MIPLFRFALLPRTDLRFLRFSGLVAWLLWAGVHIYFLIGFANRLFVLLQWLIALIIKRRAVRVLYTEPPPGKTPKQSG